MEQITNIPPLTKRRECKALIQATKYLCTQGHPMSARLKNLSSGRLKRSSFAYEARALQRQHQESLPQLLKPIAFAINDHPYQDKLRNVTIETKGPNIATKDEQSPIVKKTLTMSILEDKYPTQSWIRIYTDGSATNATKNGGAGIYIEYPNGEKKTKANPTGLYCSNYKAEEEAIIHAAQIITNDDDNTTPVVFLTDALSVLQALINDKVPNLEQALHNIKSPKIALQWIPSHCGIYGNEQADRLAKEGSEQEQEDLPVSFTEMKTIIKSLYSTPHQQDSYHQLSRSEQTIIFRLWTGHNRLNQHLNRVLKVTPSPMCLCGEAEQDTIHVLQTCKNLHSIRTSIWPTPTTLQDKL